MCPTSLCEGGRHGPLYLGQFLLQLWLVRLALSASSLVSSKSGVVHCTLLSHTVLWGVRLLVAHSSVNSWWECTLDNWVIVLLYDFLDSRRVFSVVVPCGGWFWWSTSIGGGGLSSASSSSADISSICCSSQCCGVGWGLAVLFEVSGSVPCWWARG